MCWLAGGPNGNEHSPCACLGTLAAIVCTYRIGRMDKGTHANDIHFHASRALELRLCESASCPVTPRVQAEHTHQLPCQQHSEYCIATQRCPEIFLSWGSFCRESSQMRSASLAALLADSDGSSSPVAMRALHFACLATPPAIMSHHSTRTAHAQHMHMSWCIRPRHKHTRAHTRARRYTHRPPPPRPPRLPLARRCWLGVMRSREACLSSSVSKCGHSTTVPGGAAPATNLSRSTCGMHEDTGR